ncbi:MAG: dynamin family protein [Actinomycetota bacterium]|nr:MAG: GTP-binding protein HSR1-like protein [Acidimicrobiaceae bacterium]
MSALQAVRPLLDEVRGACTDPTVGAALDRLSVRLDEPLIVALAGKVKAGKSTLLNALIGEQLAPTDAGECTQVVTWYRNGPTYRVVIELTDGSSRQVPFHRDEGALELDLGGTPVEQITRIVVDWPSSRLVDVTLIDTPGLDSIATATSARTQAFLGTADDGESGEADAVIYLMRHVHRTDLTFLEAFRDDAHAGASPISAIAVLSRADEVGACRLDAMGAASRIAESWRVDPRLRRLCQTVVPVAGLIAEAGSTLRESEYRGLATLAAMPRPRVDALLLTTDRFLNDQDCDVTQIEREDLLDRLGVFGVRLAISLIRLGAAPTANALAAELARRSGVVHLRGVLGTVLAERRDILKARVALAGLDAALTTMTDERFEPFRIRLERIGASAHEFTEVHLLNAVRSGALAFRAAEIDELDRLLGSIGGPARSRLGIGSDANLVEAVLSGVDRWRRRAENPMTPLDLADAARAVARTYEGLMPASQPDSPR